jgi:hypothetical protein
VKLDAAFKVVSTVRLESLKHGHIGDIDVKGDTLHGAFEKEVGVLVLPLAAFNDPKNAADSMQVYSVCEPDGASPVQGTSMPWCAWDESTERLFSSSFYGVTAVYAYRVDHATKRFIHDAAHDCILQLQPTATNHLDEIQGGAITLNGNVMLVSNARDRELFCFRLKDGYCLGKTNMENPHRVGKEVEGIDVRLGVKYKNFETEVHIVWLDNDADNKDDVIFQHYSVSDPTLL